MTLTTTRPTPGDRVFCRNSMEYGIFRGIDAHGYAVVRFDGDTYDDVTELASLDVVGQPTRAARGGTR